MHRNPPSKIHSVLVCLLFVVFLGTGYAINSVDRSAFVGLTALLGTSFSSESGVIAPTELTLATVNTDKDDYQPGEIVSITGSGWLPGETVRLEIEHITDGTSSGIAHITGETGSTENQPELASGHEPWYVTADSEGNITSAWLVEDGSA